MAARTPAPAEPLVSSFLDEPTPRAGDRAGNRAAGVLALVAVALQIIYPLTGGEVRDALTVAIVVTFSAACLVHAAASRGALVAIAALLITAVGGFFIEVVGVHTGVPFGGYRYTSALGDPVLGVPPVVALAWTMIAWPAAIAARRLATGRLSRIALGAWALAAADLFLDPQMVAAGYWRWDDPSPHLPGVAGVPLTNLLGWLVVSILMSAGLHRLLDSAERRRTSSDAVPLLLYLWLWLGWTIALMGFLGLPAAALWGLVAMGTVAVPLALRLWR